MTGRKAIGGLLILAGLCTMIFPSVLQYIVWNHIDLFLVVQDYPGMRIFIGIGLVLIGLMRFLTDSVKVYCMKSNDIVEALPRLPIGFYCEKELDLKTTNISHETLSNALADISNFARDINVSRVKKPCFFAICDIPLIVKTGYLIGDGTHTVRYLHYIRNKGKCIEIKGKNGVLEYSSEYIDKESNDLLVSISTSFRIKPESLNDKFLNMNRLSIETKNVNVDSITKLNDLNSFCDFAIDTIREKSQTANSVHLLLATSSSVAFAIGQRLSNTMDRPTIVYQFDNSNINNTRPWGILINSKKQTSDSSIIL